MDFDGFDPARADAMRKKRKETVRESDIESAGKKDVAADGGLSMKFKSPNHNSVPDQIELYGIQRMGEHLLKKHRLLLDKQQLTALLAAAIQFTEYKAPNEEPTGPQLREHGRLRERGFTVNVRDSK